MDWIAAAILIIGIYYAGQNKWWGWLISTIATMIWIYVGIYEEIYGMVVLNIVLAFINMYNCVKWYKYKDNEKKI